MENFLFNSELFKISLRTGVFFLITIVFFDTVLLLYYPKPVQAQGNSVDCIGSVSEQTRVAVEQVLESWNIAYGSDVLIESCNFTGETVTDVNNTATDMMDVAAVPSDDTTIPYHTNK